MTNIHVQTQRGKHIVSKKEDPAFADKVGKCEKLCVLIHFTLELHRNVEAAGEEGN